MDAAVTVAAALLIKTVGKSMSMSMPRLGKWIEASLRRVGNLTVLSTIPNSNYAALRTSCAPMAGTTWFADILQNAISLVATAQLAISSIMAAEQKIRVQKMEQIIM